MAEQEKSTFTERLVQMIIQQALGGVRKSIERFVKHAVRLIVMALSGIIFAVMGVGFAAFGIVRLLSSLMPNWLAWLVVGIILFLLGLSLTLAALITSRG